MKLMLIIFKKIHSFLFRHMLIRDKVEKIGFINNINKSMISHLSSDVVEIDRHKIFLDQEDSLRLSIYGNSEQFEASIIKKEIKKGDVVLDIGAFIGNYTLFFAKLVGDKGKVFAFEPDPKNFNLLKKNIETNGYENVVLINKAVSDKTEKTKLYLGIKSAWHKTHPFDDWSFTGKTIEVESVSLDDYFKNYSKKIDFIKMDIEGAEEKVIRGMSRLLRINENMKIATEFFPKQLKKYNINPKEYINLLVKYGFKLYNIDEWKCKIKLIEGYELLEVYTPEKGNHTNLLCLRSNK